MTPDIWQRYLWTLLPKPYKVFDSSEKREPTEVEKWAGVLADESARLHIIVQSVRDNWLLTSMSDKLLDSEGYGRGRMTRWEGESDDQYRLRLMTAFDWYALGGTVPGITTVLERLGYQDVKVLERITEEKWAEFAVEATLPFGWYFDNALLERTTRIINEIKAGHTRLVSVTLIPDIPELEEHPCRHDYCSWSHGDLWVSDLKTLGIDGTGHLLPGKLDGCFILRFLGSAVFEWSAIYSSHRFSDHPHRPIEGKISKRFIGVANFADGAHGNHKWHRARSWKCGGTWEEDCCLREIVSGFLTISRSTAVFGGHEPTGSINACFSGGVELTVSFIGAFGDDSYSMRALNGGRYTPINEFAEHTESHTVQEGFFQTSIFGNVQINA